jgi:hypothetical protein
LTEVVYADSSKWETFREEREMNPIQTAIFLIKVFAGNFAKVYKMATVEFTNEIKGLTQKFMLKLNKKLRRELNETA